MKPLIRASLVFKSRKFTTCPDRLLVAMRERDAPAARGGARRSSFTAGRLPGFADLVADQAADRCTANRSDRAATRKHSTPNGADSSANRGIFITRRHRVASAQAEQYCRGNRIDCKSLHRFH
jgi:hypothetical protein